MPENQDPQFLLEYRGPVTMKGKSEPMNVWYLRTPTGICVWLEGVTEPVLVSCMTRGRHKVKRMSATAATFGFYTNRSIERQKPNTRPESPNYLVEKNSPRVSQES
ncbi:hypothetical protein KPH14_005895 [Odynerus spinipes]|uniref:Uncharacterized protein n=1 Tax=Odynerus spinipes TaxID=1348599 RepID=A0AAD9RCC4_9HYME|nr:hypothetical protein KPH14_005895 [Odynerus spinipes]